MSTVYLICMLVGFVSSALFARLSLRFDAQVDDGTKRIPMFYSTIPPSCIIFGFGLGGLLGIKQLGFPESISPLFALGGGVLSALMVWIIMVMQRKFSQGLIGKQALVSKPISTSGVGRICFPDRRLKKIGPACSEDKKDIKQHALVTITRVVGIVYYVREHPSGARARPKLDSDQRSSPSETY